MKKRTAIFPGSFNPFHEGHREVVEKALKAFDRVIVAKGINPLKAKNANSKWTVKIPKGAEYMEYCGLLRDFAKSVNADVIIKGLRNGEDLEYEAAQQYWNSQIGLELPTMFIIASPELRYMSSTAKRQIEKLRSEITVKFLKGKYGNT